MRLSFPLLHFVLYSLGLLTHGVPIATRSLLASSGSVCDPSATGPNLRARQEATFKDYIHIFFEERDVQRAFDTYVPGEYINHVSSASTQGRDSAIAGLLALQADPNMIRDHVTLFTGGGYRLVYYRRWIPESAEVNWAVMDKLRFEGTCLVEIWSVSQRILGNETNTIAFF